MAAKSYFSPDSFEQDKQHLLSPTMPSPGLSSGPTSPLKPLHLLNTHYHHHSGSWEGMEQIKEAQRADAKLKARIRRLRIVSRVLAFLISIAVLVPISMTLVKFLRTQNIYRDVTDAQGRIHSRTAWAKDTRAWPTWAYWAVAATSMLLNLATVFSYRFGIEQANTTSYIASIFSWVVMLGNLIVWSIAATMYRTERDKNGKPNDLWGWTCSPAAQKIQKEFAKEVNFDKFCNVQSVSWYIGLFQAGAALLTVVIYLFVFMRKASKKQLQAQLRRSAFEPTRRQHI